MSTPSRAARTAQPDEEVLHQLRIPFVQRVRVEHGAGLEDLFTFDLGMRGIFVERTQPLPHHAPVTVSFRIPGNELEVSARCRVAWWHAPDAPLVSKRLPAGLGLEFRDIGEVDLRRIREHVLDHWRTEGRGRRFQRPWPAAEDDLP